MLQNMPKVLGRQRLDLMQYFSHAHGKNMADLKAKTSGKTPK